MRPGLPWAKVLEGVIETAKSAAVFVGESGLGPWEEQETHACLVELVDRKLPLIPVLLPGAATKPNLPIFLRLNTWVDLREGLIDTGLNQLQFGITGIRSAPTDPSVAD